MRLLDLFCGAGGAAMGYHRAGFTGIVGVDNKPMPRYPFTFVEGDALEYLAQHGHEFDVIHASPPCQAYSWAAKRWVNAGKEYPDLVEATRNLIPDGKPFVIENVPNSPLDSVLMLCGTMFGLSVIRHRHFECGYLLYPPSPCRHSGSVKGGEYVTVAGHGGDGKASHSAWSEAMDIDWMIHKELAQAIPPAYTEWIGKQLLSYLSPPNRRVKE